MKTTTTSTAPGRAQASRAAVVPAISGKHLRITIPIDWLAVAARLPGRSLHVGVALLILAAQIKAPVVPLSNLAGRLFGLDRNAKYRGLVWLEEAGLIAVERKLGRAPIVTILNGDLGTPEEP